MLTVINEYRRQHGAPYLQWSETCAREAQKRASHRSGAAAEFGENLARSTSPDWRNQTTACIASVERWQVRSRVCVSSVYTQVGAIDAIDREETSCVAGCSERS